MIGYATLGTNDLDKAKSFYDNLFALIDVKQLFKTETMIAWGKDYNSPMIMITIPYNKKPASVGNGSMIAIKVETTELVDRLHQKALQLGATDEGEAGPRGKNFYGGYFRDLDGNKLNFYCIPK